MRRNRWTWPEIVAVLALLGLGILGFHFQFRTYQKKHGQHMTVWDFLIDPERK